MTTEITITDAMQAGIAGLGIATTVILVILVILTVRFATTGRVGAAVLCGMVLLCLLSPLFGLALALIILIVTAFIGDVRIGGSAMLGWGMGLVLSVVIVFAAVAVGLVTVQ